MIWFHFSKPRRKILIPFAASLAAVRLLASPATDQEQLVAANTAFAFNLLNRLVQAQPAANVFISPFSVSRALQAVSDGAQDETQAELQLALKTVRMAPVALKAACLSLNQQFAARKEVTLDLATGLWLQEGFHWQPAFVDDNRKFFQAELADVNFDQPQSAKTINDWADRQTDGKVKQVVQSPFPPRTRLVLASAAYFKGEWAMPFKPQLTHSRDFHLANGQSKPAPMMERPDYFLYQARRGFQAVALPYKGALQMELFLPATNSNPEKLLAALAAPGRWLKDIQSGFSHRDGAVILPKFKFACALRLKDALQSLGIKSAFAPDADFSGLAEKRVGISEVRQASFVSVNELGAEAAAATTVHVAASATELASPISFVMLLDRPFVAVIADVPSNSILFMGVVNDPTGGQ